MPSRSNVLTIHQETVVHDASSLVPRPLFHLRPDLGEDYKVEPLFTSRVSPLSSFLEPPLLRAAV